MLYDYADFKKHTVVNVFVESGLVKCIVFSNTQIYKYLKITIK